MYHLKVMLERAGQRFEALNHHTHIAQHLCQDQGWVIFALPVEVQPVGRLDSFVHQLLHAGSAYFTQPKNNILGAGGKFFNSKRQRSRKTLEKVN